MGSCEELVNDIREFLQAKGLIPSVEAVSCEQTGASMATIKINVEACINGCSKNSGFELGRNHIEQAGHGESEC